MAIVEFDWYPEPLVVAGEISDIAGALEQLEVPLAASLPQVSAAIARHFLEEGPGWPYWSDSYAPFAEANNEGILRQDGDLFDAATSEEALEVADDSIIWTGAGVPEMWEWHEFGRERSKGGVLPARPFIGLDTEAEVAITAIFMVWLEQVIAGASTKIVSVGKSGKRIQGAGGRFIKGA